MSARLGRYRMKSSFKRGALSPSRHASSLESERELLDEIYCTYMSAHERYEKLTSARQFRASAAEISPTFKYGKSELSFEFADERIITGPRDSVIVHAGINNAKRQFALARCIYM